jgi:GNAT superfamily N-acetyltransferase
VPMGKCTLSHYVIRRPWRPARISSISSEGTVRNDDVHADIGDLDLEVAWWLEMAEAEVYAEVYGVARDWAGSALGAEVAEIGGGIATALTGFDIGFFNRTIGLGIAQEMTPDDVDAVVDFYDGLDRATSVIQLAPQAKPSNATDWLAERGFAPSRRWAKLWRPVDEPAQTSTPLAIRRAEGPEDEAAFERVISEAFGFPAAIGSLASAVIGRPGWTHYLGFDGRGAVCAAAMRVLGDYAWLGYGATLESFRGRGGQSAMFAARLRDAAALGCRIALTETGEETADAPNPSYRNMKRLGFRDAYMRRNWVRSRAAE